MEQSRYYELEQVREVLAQRDNKLHQMKTLRELMANFQEEVTELEEHARQASEYYLRKYGECPLEDSDA